MFLSSSAAYFLKEGARFSLKVTTKASFGSKKALKFKFLGYFPKAKSEQYDKKKFIW